MGGHRLSPHSRGDYPRTMRPQEAVGLAGLRADAERAGVCESWNKGTALRAEGPVEERRGSGLSGGAGPIPASPRVGGQRRGGQPGAGQERRGTDAALTRVQQQQ